MPAEGLSWDGGEAGTILSKLQRESRGPGCEARRRWGLELLLLEPEAEVGEGAGRGGVQGCPLPARRGLCKLKHERTLIR